MAMLSTTDYSILFKCSSQTAINLINRGVLEAEKYDRKWAIDIPQTKLPLGYAKTIKDEKDRRYELFKACDAMPVFKGTPEESLELFIKSFEGGE